MMNGIVIFFRFLKDNFGKFVLGFFLVVVFLYVLFPFSDLNDLVSAQVSKATQNKVFLQFDDLHINPLTASVSLDKVYVETPQISNISVNELSATPSIAALIKRKPGGTLTAQGFMKGDVKISIAPSGAASKTEGPDGGKGEKYSIDITAQNLSLKEIREAAGLNLPLKGSLSVATQATADISFTEQPEGEVALTINKFELPPSSVSLGEMGRVNLPEIKLGQIELKGKLSNGKFVIENGKIGNSKDEFYGDVKGDLNITIQNLGGQMIPMIGAYNISLDLKANNGFRERAKFFLSFLDGYKRDLPDGAQYKFKVQAQAMGLPPQIQPLQ